MQRESQIPLAQGDFNGIKVRQCISESFLLSVLKNFTSFSQDPPSKTAFLFNRLYQSIWAKDIDRLSEYLGGIFTLLGSLVVWCSVGLWNGQHVWMVRERRGEVRPLWQSIPGNCPVWFVAVPTGTWHAVGHSPQLPSPGLLLSLLCPNPHDFFFVHVIPLPWF